ncbi:MAG: M56 family metallopeptidase [Lachnospiraceae bacterium]|nr:M56 family metallopeptidase [Lachnospiraceae bacterium]
MTGIFLLFLESSISVGLIAAGLILLTPFLNKRYAAKWKYWVWIFLSVRLIIPFEVTDAFLQTKTQNMELEKDNAAVVPRQPVSLRRIVVEMPAQVTAPITMQFSAGSARVTLLDLAAVIWLLGSLAFLAVHLVSYLLFKRQVRTAGIVIEESDVQLLLAQLQQELNIKSDVCAVEFPGASSPMMTGFLKPVLILPQKQYCPRQLYFILKHELVHLKRRDVSIKLLFAAANAVHWFNPLIWMMQKEAVIDMELSCDECVTRGADYAVREAYAETLLATLHERCTRGNRFLTRFYSEKQIMKMRFRNILERSGKKRGIFILIATVFLTAVLGIQTGYSAAKENAEGISDLPAEQSTVASLAADKLGADYPPVDSTVTDVLENTGTVPSAEEEAAGQDSVLERTKLLVFFKEGEAEEKRAELVTEDGYFIYLPEGDWRQAGSGEWTGVVNEQVRLWVTHFENEAIEAVSEEIAADGYVVPEYGDLTKLQGDMIYKVRLYVFEGDVWGVFYCFPSEAEEGWGMELPVIADTFGLWTAAESGHIF